VSSSTLSDHTIHCEEIVIAWPRWCNVIVVGLRMAHVLTIVSYFFPLSFSTAFCPFIPNMLGMSGMLGITTETRGVSGCSTFNVQYSLKVPTSPEMFPEMPNVPRNVPWLVQRSLKCSLKCSLWVWQVVPLYGQVVMVVAQDDGALTVFQVETPESSGVRVDDLKVTHSSTKSHL
jgi:hypothetical protein